MLSRDNIMEIIAKGHLKIYPFEKKNLTGIGYNLSTTSFAFSINKGILLTIHYRTTNNGVERYVIIPKNDTVLFFSKEYIEIDRTIAGSFHSKVSCVCQGLGHISTTLDPTWKGQLIISVNNPTAKEINFDLDKNSGNIMTLLLHNLDTEVTGSDIHDNNQGRCDLLLEHFSKPFSNQQYRNKHLQLKEFVVSELANSLNGDDCFISSNCINDKYTQKVKRLVELRDRLREDRTAIEEKRYPIGEEGEYHCFKNINESNLLRGCSLFGLKEQYNELKLTSDGIKKDDLGSVSSIISEYDEIISYELDMINHIRRINWQNEKMDQFAGEDSELVKLRHREEKKVRRIRFCIPIFFILLITTLFIYSLVKLNVSVLVGTIFITIYAPILTLVLQWWYRFWKMDDSQGG